MTYSEHYLGKPVEQLNVADDIEPFLRRDLPEGQNLEYKSGGQLADHGDVVSAFLNSGGGLLIIGAPAEEEIVLPGGERKRVCRGPMRPIPRVSKDDARRSLLSKVTPIPASVRISSMPHAEGSVVAVDVETSHYPPHQHDGSYWIRLDGETRRAPHAFVEALFLQRQGPNLEGEVVATRLRTMPSPHGFIDYWELELQVRVLNRSRNIAEYAAIDLKTDPSMEARPEILQASDPQPGDTLLPVVRATNGERLFRYRLRGDVLHAYEWKSFEGRFHIEKAADAPRQVSLKLELQAKDMLRRRYDFEIDLGNPGRNIVLVPTRTDTVGPV